jgi:hypothetical protein
MVTERVLRLRFSPSLLIAQLLRHQRSNIPPAPQELAVDEAKGCRPAAIV